jgi:hypothetical protein
MPDTDTDTESPTGRRGGDEEPVLTDHTHSHTTHRRRRLNYVPCRPAVRSLVALFNSGRALLFHRRYITCVRAKLARTCTQQHDPSLARVFLEINYSMILRVRYHVCEIIPCPFLRAWAGERPSVCRRAAGLFAGGAAPCMVSLFSNTIIYTSPEMHVSFHVG